MDSKVLHIEIGEMALDMLSRQSFIPGQLIEERHGEVCVCTGAAMLYGAHQRAHGGCAIQEFFAACSTMGDQQFVSRECKRYGLDVNVVWDIIIVSKGFREECRPSAVADIVYRRVAEM
jgi:hypothetical protein